MVSAALSVLLLLSLIFGGMAWVQRREIAAFFRDVLEASDVTQ